MIIYIVGGVGLIVILLIAFTIYKIRNASYCSALKEKIDKVFVRIKNAVFWSTIVLSFTVTYLQLGVSAGLEVERFLQNDSTQS